MAKIVNLLVHCGGNNALITEYLAKVGTTKFLVGAKRNYTPPAVAPSGNGEHENSNIFATDGDKIIETTNGVEWDCLHCQSDSMFRCTECMTFTCHARSNPVTCAGCGKIYTRFSPLKSLDVNEPPPNDSKQITAKKLTNQKGNSQGNRPGTKRLPKG